MKMTFVGNLFCRAAMPVSTGQGVGGQRLSRTANRPHSSKVTFPLAGSVRAVGKQAPQPWRWADPYDRPTFFLQVSTYCSRFHPPRSPRRRERHGPIFGALVAAREGRSARLYGFAPLISSGPSPSACRTRCTRRAQNRSHQVFEVCLLEPGPGVRPDSWWALAILPTVLNGRCEDPGSPTSALSETTHCVATDRTYYPFP